MIIAFVVLCLVSLRASGQTCESYEEWSTEIEDCELKCANPMAGGCTIPMPNNEAACRCTRGLYRHNRTGECVKLDDCYDYSSESEGN